MQKHKRKETKNNTELATYGDAILKLALCIYFFEEAKKQKIEIEKLTEKKKVYESDKYLIERVAEHYELIKYISFDEDDKNIPKDYEIVDHCKYIATTVEAVIAAIYIKENKDIDKIVNLVAEWIKLDKIKTNNKGA